MPICIKYVCILPSIYVANMTPHDLEVKRYNDLMNRLNQIEALMLELMDHPDAHLNTKLVNDNAFLCAVYIKDAKYIFKKYANQVDDL
jgi:hypothetical protein